MDEATSAEELNELGIELVDRYEQEGDPALLRRAREAHEQALRKAVTAADRAAYLNNVGNCLRLEYWETRDPADLEVARQRFESAVAAAPPGSADRPMYLDNLALALRTSTPIPATGPILTAPWSCTRKRWLRRLTRQRRS